jgi:hypothetical protein
MATRIRGPVIALIAVLLLAFASAISLSAEESYSYELGADGVPAFTQTIRWDAIEYAQKYRLEIVDANGTSVADDTAGTTDRTVHLAPGEYRYRISVYNLLGKTEYAGPWVIMRVLKAELPSIRSIEPKSLTLPLEGQRLTIAGESLLSSSRVTVIDATTGLNACEASVHESGEGKKIVVELPSDALTEGEYRVAVENPGGLRAESSGSFRVRPARASRVKRPAEPAENVDGAGAGAAGPSAGPSAGPVVEPTVEAIVESAAPREPLPLEVSASVGWSPEIVVFDEWFNGAFGGRAYTAGFSLDVACAYSKWAPFAFGARADASWVMRSFDVGSIAVASDRRLAGVSAFVSYAPMKPLSILAGFGGALAWTWVSLDNGESVAEVATIDPAFYAYTEALYTFYKSAYAGAGAEFLRIAYSDASGVTIVPRIFAGWVF